MSLPFTIEEFLAVFRAYNEAVWPAQWALLAVGLAAVGLAISQRPGAGRWILFLLAALWAWMGIAYHLAFFRAINPAATLFAVAFVVQGLLLASLALRREMQCRFGPRHDAAGVTGALLVAYALVVYPGLAAMFGHRYPETPTFGLPCPTTILTLGVLLWAARIPWWAFVIPLLWALVSSIAVLRLGMWEDAGLLVAGGASLLVLTVARIRNHVVVAEPGPPVVEPSRR